MKKLLLATTGLAALLAFGCNNGGTPAPTSSPATGSSPSAEPTQAPVSVSTPTVAAAADAGFDKAKSQKGYDDVVKLGKNPFEGDLEATKKGAELFATNCASCHGPGGMGDGPAGMALNPKPRNMTVSGDYAYGHGDLGIFRTTKYGVEGTGMAGWEGRMTDEECWQVVNYVRTLQKS